MGTRLLAMTSIASLLLVAAACGDDSDGDSALVDNVSSGSEEDEGDEGREDGGQTEAGEPVDATAGDVIGTTEGSYPSSAIDSTSVPVTAEITRLERSGEHVELVVVLTNNHESAEFSIGMNFQDGSADRFYTASGIKLVDGAAQLAYLPVVDSSEACLCSADLSAVNVLPGETAQLEATFGGLPSDLAAVDVHIPGMSTLSAVSVAG
jgi:hypothetical protein